VAFDGLRDYLDRLDEAGLLWHIEKEVDADHELAAVIRHLRDKPVIFHNVRGHSVPVVGNLFGNWSALEVALERDRTELLQSYQERVRHPLEPVLVPTGPVKERIILGDDIDLATLPIPTLNALDAGKYIDAGIIVASDPEYGANLSIQRMQIQGPREAGIWIAPMMHLEAYRQRAEERGEALEIAVVIGCDPSLYIASQAYEAVDTDEYDIAGGIREKPVELVQCETVNLQVPAHAEIVLEGRILPGVRRTEGPFGEFTGYYGTAGERPVVEFTAITMRREPIFQTIYIRKPPAEGVLLSSLPKAASLFELLKKVVPEVQGVYLPPAGCGKYHAVVSIRKRHDGEGKQALLAVLASHMAVKHAVVVDADIDIYDHDDVEWAVATRSQFDLDSIVVTGAPHNLDPSATKHGNNLITKVGVDATLPMVHSFPPAVDVRQDVLADVRANWASYGAHTRTPADTSA
jgi:2,5-furandicarboxylate decarboxylase 1